MTALVRAEWTKLFTTRVWLGLLLGSCVLVALGTVLSTVFAGEPPQPGQPPLPEVGEPLYERIVLAGTAEAAVMFLILGIIGTTQEFRHRTATPTFLTTPRRGRVVTAKLVAYALAAALLALVLSAFNLVVMVIASGGVPSLGADNLEVIGRAGLVLVFYAVLGVGLGALLRNQVAAIVGGLVYLFVVEGLLQFISATQPVYKWLPGGAPDAVLPTLLQIELLEPWQGGLVLLGYGLVTAVLGTFLAVRRDVV